MFRRELLHTLATLWRTPGLSRAQLESFRDRKLRIMVRHAYRRVGFYRALFDRAGVDPRDIRCAADLARLPVTDKNDLRACGLEQLISSHTSPERLVKRITSGSAGRPFVVRRGRLEDHVIDIFRRRAQLQLGVRPRDRLASIVAFIPGENRDSALTRLRSAAGLFRASMVSCLQPAEQVCRELEALDPDVVTGYAGAVAHVAPFLRGRLAGRRLHAITCGGEALTPAKRAAIEQGFGLRPLDMFGAHECNNVAWECRRSGLYHVCDDNAVFEVLRDGRPAEPGEKGEVVLTTLHAYAMPFIRYRLGDMVVRGPSPCPCGQPFSTFERIEGRVREYFDLPDGRRVHPLEVVLPVICENAPWMNQFQLTQETATGFVLRLSTLRPPNAQEQSLIEHMVRERLGRGAALRLALVDHIPFEPSGKFKDCRNLLQPDP